MITHGDLFAGIGGMNHELMTLPDLNSPVAEDEKLLNRYRSYFCQAMAIRAEQDTVFEDKSPTVSLGRDVMSVARRLAPSASHTSVPIQALEGLHPCAFGGILLPLGDDIGLSSVPSLALTIALDHLSIRRARMVLPVFAVLMPVHEPAGSPLVIKAPEHGAASTSTRNLLAQRLIAFRSHTSIIAFPTLRNA